MPRFLLNAPGPRPPFTELAEHLWGPDCDFDSDGDSFLPDDTDWTELTITLRMASGENDDDQRVDIDPVEGADPLTLVIKSDNDAVARRAAAFLQTKAGGTLSPG